MHDRSQRSWVGVLRDDSREGTKEEVEWVCIKILHAIRISHRINCDRRDIVRDTRALLDQPLLQVKSRGAPCRSIANLFAIRKNKKKRRGSKR
ncbi:hypothetical protein BC938DRAFT_482514 [Jimgerdemannia flammicorona]|uniref:Uncharacterized protein n=1 Tax=Jimgerdemannia flammicorona TaxID=994334 RepID=A0A433QDS6_9FUNG|nr:hypothetical protein BC938DRAFT_482514 [Jimgerdemannia flammicorona]